MIDAWGGWPLFQELLAVLKNIADKHRVGIANVGMRYVLDRPAVAGVIVGAGSAWPSTAPTMRGSSVGRSTTAISR